MAEERSLRVDEATFAEAKEKSVVASKIQPATDGTQGVTLDVHDLAVLEKTDRIGKTNDDAKYRKFR
jgi:hypothetical protein